jgi:hypothetical protein
LIVLEKNDIFAGESYADMINKAIGTNYNVYRKSAVGLAQFGADGVIARFVFTDGGVHGYDEGWKWRNYLSNGGTEIKEYNVSASNDKLIKKHASDGYFPFRLSFCLDPDGIRDNHRCKFVGAYRLSGFINEDLTAITYSKVADTFRLGSKGEIGDCLNNKKDFIKNNSSYAKPPAEPGFSDRVFRLLKKLRISCAGDLLELGIETTGETADEIHKKLFECFGVSE